MKSIKWILHGAVLALTLNFAIPAVQAEELLDSVKASGVLKIGLEGTYPPFGYRNESGDLDGYDVAVARAVADRMGLKPQFITTEWSGIIAGLQSGKFDVIVNQVTITPQRQASLEFSTPYTYSAVQMIQRSNDKRDLKTLDDLKGKSVGVVLGTNFADLVKPVAAVSVKTYPGTPEVLRDLAASRIDATLNDRLLLPYLLKNANLPLRAGAALPGTNTEMGIPFRKGNPKFAKAINDAINSLRQDGTLRALSMKWLGSDASEPIAQ